MTIRLASSDDVLRLVEMGEAFHAAAEEPHPFDRQSFIQTLSVLMRDDGSGFVIVAGELGAAVGMIGVLVFPVYYSLTHKDAQELFWWAEPGHRGRGRELLAMAETTAKAFGAERLINQSLAALKGTKIRRLYLRAGYRLHGEIFVKEL